MSIPIQTLQPVAAPAVAWADLVPAYVRALAPYQPGKPIAELAREMGLAEAEIVKLASNENPLGMSPKAKAAVLAAVDDLARYPDGSGFSLKAKLAQMHGVHTAQIVLGNGSNDLLDMVARAFLAPGCSSVFSQYCFAVYPLATLAVGAESIVVRAVDYGHDLPAMLAAIRPDTRVVWIANPNNPTGTIARPGDLLEFMERCPSQVLVVLDEAYTEYLPAAQRPDSVTWLRRFPNLVVVRTLSKAYGLAGLRVGYALCQPEVADLLNRVRQPFNVNSLALAAAEAALDDWDFLRQTVALNQAGMQQLTQAFSALGLAYIASAGNFVTFHCGDAAMLNQYLLQRGVIVRPIAGYGMPHSLRVSIGTQAENARFIEVLQSAMAV